MSSVKCQVPSQERARHLTLDTSQFLSSQRKERAALFVVDRHRKSRSRRKATIRRNDPEPLRDSSRIARKLDLGSRSDANLRPIARLAFGLDEEGDAVSVRAAIPLQGHVARHRREGKRGARGRRELRRLGGRIDRKAGRAQQDVRGPRERIDDRRHVGCLGQQCRPRNILGHNRGLKRDSRILHGRNLQNEVVCRSLPRSALQGRETVASERRIDVIGDFLRLDAKGTVSQVAELVLGQITLTSRVSSSVKKLFAHSAPRRSIGIFTGFI